jgi:hypothetical protein
VTLSTLFLVCNYSVLPAWALLVFAPRSPWTRRLVHSMLIPMVLGLVYAWAFVASPGAPEGGNFFTLAGVMALFTSPQVAVAGWVHYLIFDLFIGAWEARDAERRGIAHVWVVPCLLLTFVLGPLGLLSYLALRFVMKREPLLAETRRAST